MWARKLKKRPYLSATPFTPFPSAFVFPGLQLVVISIFLTGTAINAVTVIASGQTRRCGEGICWCRVLAYAALGVAGIYFLAAAYVLVRFNACFRTATWQPASPVTSPSAVEDPIFRAISKLRARLPCLHRAIGGSKNAALEREKGSFVRPEDEIGEPGRTERLLARPCALARAKASDTIDAYGFSLLARSGGATKSVVWFEVNVMFGQLVVAVLYGLGVGLELEAGSLGASAQVLSILAVQAFVALWVFQMSPSHDRLQTALVGTQFALEGGQSALLLAYTFLLQPELERASFVLAVSALCAPILLLLYDAIVVPLSKALRSKGSLGSGLDACATLLCYLPRSVMMMMGFEGAQHASYAENAGDDMQKMKERMHDNMVSYRSHSEAQLAADAPAAANDDGAGGLGPLGPRSPRRQPRVKFQLPFLASSSADPPLCSPSEEASDAGGSNPSSPSSRSSRSSEALAALEPADPDLARPGYSWLNGEVRRDEQPDPFPSPDYI